MENEAGLAMRIAGPAHTKRRVLHSLLSAVFLLLAAGTLQRDASAQPGRAAGAQGAPQTPGQNRDGLRVYIWAGLKSHGEGQHDYPQFLADWSKILTAHGAVVDGALHSPRATDLEHADVVVI